MVMIETGEKRHPIIETGQVVAETWDKAGRTIATRVNHSLYTAKDVKDRLGRVLVTKALMNPYMLPSEIVPYQDAVEEARAMRHEGYAFIVPYNHSNKREPLDCTGTMFNLGEGFAGAEYLSPLAWHQRKFDVTALSALTGVHLVDIVTSDTVEKGANVMRQGVWEKLETRLQGRPVEPKILPERYGLSEYVDQGGDVLSRGGIVLVAPQGGRRDRLGEPKGRPVEMLIRNAQRKGTEKIAIWPMGIALKGMEEFNASTSGLNLRKTAEVKFGIPVTLDEMRTLTHEHNEEYGTNLNLDQYIFTELSGLLPDAYVNPQPY